MARKPPSRRRSGTRAAPRGKQASVNVRIQSRSAPARAADAVSDHTARRAVQAVAALPVELLHDYQPTPLPATLHRALMRSSTPTLQNVLVQAIVLLCERGNGKGATRTDGD